MPAKETCDRMRDIYEMWMSPVRRKEFGKRPPTSPIVVPKDLIPSTAFRSLDDARKFVLWDGHLKVKGQEPGYCTKESGGGSDADYPSLKEAFIHIQSKRPANTESQQRMNVIPERPVIASRLLVVYHPPNHNYTVSPPKS
eukprot:TRINITY_DN3115_c0_g1_i1.p1 TRINITY_DN3115_c0_g1~~TRINITY_DN3115_c0_g1_i1.p1  ORF type:complete len:141 (+),score=31.92 TRINITY_DN3115_c0_g1_i1:448-870(+)